MWKCPINFRHVKIFLESFRNLPSRRWSSSCVAFCSQLVSCVYRNLSYKGVAALKWIATYCSRAVYVMKCDDDVFVNMFALLKHLSDLYAHGFRHRLIICLVWWRMHVLRQGKWGKQSDPYFTYNKRDSRLVCLHLRPRRNSTISDYRRQLSCVGVV